MKRILSCFTLILFCLAALCAPVMAEEAAAFVGVWIETEGYGTLTIRQDGTATMAYYDGSMMETTWSLTDDGCRFGDGMWYNSPMALLDENTLSVSSGWMIFVREGFLPTTDEALLLGAEPVGEEGAPFLGTWALCSVILEGEAYDPALFDMTMTLTFHEDGTVVSDEGGELYTTTWSVSYGSAIVEGDILTISEDGKLIYSVSDGQMIFDKVVEEESAAPAAEVSTELTGVWTLLSVEMDGDMINPALFGMSMTLTLNEDGTAAFNDGEEVSTANWYVSDAVVYVDGMPLTLDDNGCLVLEEDGAKMLFAQGEATPSEAPSEEEQWLALMGLLEGSDDEGDGWGEDDGWDDWGEDDGWDDWGENDTWDDWGEDDAWDDWGEDDTWDDWDASTELSEAQLPYVGEWYMVYCHTGGLTGDLRIMDVNGYLTLDADGTGYLISVTDEFGVWYEEEGVIRFGESGTPMYLLGDEADGTSPFLQYGTEEGGYMIFHQDEEAVWTPGLYPLEGAVPAMPAASDAPVSSGSALLMETRYVCKSYTASGFTLDAATLGAEYAAVFHANGTVDFVLAGIPLTGLPCTAADGAYVIDYYGNPLSCVPTDAGFDMDYFGSMTMHFVPAE